MFTSFPDLSFQLQGALVPARVKLSRGHIQQALAAILGYNTLAALQASTQEEPGIFGAHYVIADMPGLLARLGQLGHSLAVSSVISRHLLSALRTISHGQVTIFDSLTQFVDDIVIRSAESDIANNNRDVIAEMVMTNACGGYTEVEYDGLGISIDDGTKDYWQLEIQGQAVMEQDPDKGFLGDRVAFEGLMSYRRAGRTCLMAEAKYDLEAAVVGSIRELELEIRQKGTLQHHQ